MTPEELKEARKSLGLSANKMAEALGLGKNGGRTVRRYETGEIKPSGTVLKLLKIFLESKENKNGRI